MSVSDITCIEMGPRRTLAQCDYSRKPNAYVTSRTVAAPFGPTEARNARVGVVLTCVGPLEGGRTRTYQRLLTPMRNTDTWYATTRAKVEARAALEQAEELRRALEEMGRELRGEVP